MTPRGLLRAAVVAIVACGAMLARTRGTSSKAVPPVGAHRDHGDSAGDARAMMQQLSRDTTPPTTAESETDDALTVSVESDVHDDVPLTLEQLGGVRPLDIWTAEARDAAFANERELSLRDWVVKNMRGQVPYATSVDVECRETSCRVAVRGESQSNDLNIALQAIDLPLLDVVSEIGPLKDADGTRLCGLQIVILFSRSQRNPDFLGYRFRPFGAVDLSTEIDNQ